MLSFTFLAILVIDSLYFNIPVLTSHPTPGKYKAARNDFGRLVITNGLFQIFQRIDCCAVLADFKMQVGSRRAARITHNPDLASLLKPLSN